MIDRPTGATFSAPAAWRDTTARMDVNRYRRSSDQNLVNRTEVRDQCHGRGLSVDANRAGVAHEAESGPKRKERK
jgi:hypothetical protein